ncbi:MAG: efflux RND transporter periplasmic adaptor subunit [Pseudomonadota bacterium]
MMKILRFLAGTTMRLAAIVLFGALGYLGFTYFTAEAQNTRKAEPFIQPVLVETLRSQQTYIVSRKFSGRLNAAQVSDLGFDLGGEVETISVAEGIRVSAGQELAALDRAALREQRQELDAARREATARLTRAEATFKRIEPLVPEAATQQRLDDVRAERDAARAAVARIRASIDVIDVSLEKSVLTAPFEGEIVIRYVDEGAVVSGGQPIVRINAGGAIEAEIGIPVRFRSQIEIGKTYALQAGDQTGRGVAKQIVNDINVSTQTITVLFDVVEDPGFVPSDLVRLALTDTVRGEGYWVDNGALQQSLRGLWAVFSVVPDGDDPAAPGTTGVIARNDVEIIHVEEDRSYVRGALEDGMLLVRSAPLRFVPGQRVRIERILDSGADVSAVFERAPQ